jgi:hypothetical protein
MTLRKAPDGVTGGLIQSGGNSRLRPRVRSTELSNAEGEPLAPGAGKGRRTKLAAMGLSPGIIKAGDPDYSKTLYQANKYRKVRMKEIAELHGHVSAGVGALLASASLALAGSRFLYQKAAEDGDSTLLKQASQLAAEAQRHELAAWEIAAKEGVLKRRQETTKTNQPWILTVDGNEKKKVGRKTNEERKARELGDIVESKENDYAGYGREQDQGACQTSGRSNGSPEENAWAGGGGYDDRSTGETARRATYAGSSALVRASGDLRATLTAVSGEEQGTPKESELRGADWDAEVQRLIGHGD